ncbi:MAG: 2-C-methyl-D-erythritol 2,4-cyclodiphosphate synthase [Muribaculaceae bacterium]|nr:2-C-methyl-D-erythritol 2,4-cyclodiphosphate synthase [Muribaculaceae bacterium]
MENKVSLRIGNGFDVHRLVEGRRCIICGVDIPHEKGLLGHSDADVALHALSDALLGAVALGDIGLHFPDTDPAWEGADSRMLLRAVKNLLAQKGYDVVNVDITIMAQAPKMLPYIEEMRRNVAADLEIELDCASVKATTTERLGFTGRKEGIAAFATALVSSR